MQSTYNQEIHVLKYGSDPLKTYLPDSDIDITIIVNNNFRQRTHAAAVVPHHTASNEGLGGSESGGSLGPGKNSQQLPLPRA